MTTTEILKSKYEISSLRVRLTKIIQLRQKLTDNLVTDYKDNLPVLKAIQEHIRSEFVAFSKLSYFLKCYEEWIANKTIPYEEGNTRFDLYGKI